MDAAGHTSVYYNGALVANVTATGAPAGNAVNAVARGANFVGRSSPPWPDLLFDGFVADLRIYGVALGAADVAALFAASTAC